MLGTPHGSVRVDASMLELAKFLEVIQSFNKLFASHNAVKSNIGPQCDFNTLYFVSSSSCSSVNIFSAIKLLYEVVSKYFQIAQNNNVLMGHVN